MAVPLATTVERQRTALTLNVEQQAAMDISRPPGASMRPASSLSDRKVHRPAPLRPDSTTGARNSNPVGHLTVDDVTTHTEAGGPPLVLPEVLPAGRKQSAAERRKAEQEQRVRADLQRYVYIRERNGIRLTKYEGNPLVRQAYNVSANCARPSPTERT